MTSLSIFAGVLSTLVILMLYARLRRAEIAATIALHVAEGALDHNEMAVDLAEDSESDEAEEEREWIAEQRARLVDARILAELPAPEVSSC